MDIKVDKGPVCEKNVEWDLIVVGGGVAAQSFLHLIIQENIDKKKILQIAANDIFTPCSHRTTSIVSLDGIKKNISPLGDKLFDAYNYFEKIQKKMQYKSVYEGILKVCNDDENTARRFGDHPLEDGLFKIPVWFVDAQGFLSELGENSNGAVSKIKGLVTQIIERDKFLEVTTLDSTYLSKAIVLALGYGEKYTEENSQTSVVAGHYLRVDFDLTNLKKACVYQWKNGKNNIRFYLRKNENCLMIGSYNEKNELQLPDHFELFNIHQFVKNKFSDFAIPDFKEWQAYVGLRAKGKKMHPSWGIRAGHQRIYEIKNLYKNGLSLAPFAASEIIPEILAEIQ